METEVVGGCGVAAGRAGRGDGGGAGVDGGVDCWLEGLGDSGCRGDCCGRCGGCDGLERLGDGSLRDSGCNQDDGG